MSLLEAPDAAAARWKRLDILQRAYPDFVPFLQDMMEELGFTTDEIQEDIADFLENGPLYLMVQAQRGQAKTTITAIFSVWCLIHDPTYRVLIFSAGDRQASEISTLIIRIILRVDILECLRPDKQAGDRTSVEAFDVHHSLKGTDKSPSVACMGITANLQGARADLLIADDVESGKNSRTAVQREQLLHITRDFTSINSTGRILYLGTPQSIESIYNTLPGRGFTVRIWPGRYPNKEQAEAYKDLLAPLIAERIRKDPSLTTGYGVDGNQGKATSPVIVPESRLLTKELDQGKAYFQLQHMLLTALSDAARFPLHLKNIVVMRLNQAYAPMTVVRGFGALRAFTINGKGYNLASYHDTGAEVGKVQSTVLYVDPAGGGLNGDETGWACVSLLNSNLFARGIGGVAGGYEGPQLQAVADLVKRFRPSVVKIEKNLGFGAYKAIITPVIKTTCEEYGIPMPGIEEDYVTGQKEARIIATLEPIIGRGALVFDESILEEEEASLQRYDLSLRDSYCVLNQISKMTRERGALIHDDRVDALEGACRHFAAALAVDQQKAVEAANAREHAEWVKNPTGRRLNQRGPHPRLSMMAARIRVL